MKKTTKKNQQKQIQSQDTVKYPELNDFELEVICGGGNLIGKNR